MIDVKNVFICRQMFLLRFFLPLKTGHVVFQQFHTTTLMQKCGKMLKKHITSSKL